MDKKTLDGLCINAIRFLSIDAVQKANSGHPGAPMGAAAMAYVLWDRFLKHDPRDPQWPDRDRFILSAGHASAMLYALLHLTGYDVSLDDLKSFRQWGSRTPGHPEYGMTPGVEATTGPLGQGFSIGVGMAIAERRLSQQYNKTGHDIVNHYIYAICSDGDLQEGVASEAASLAGTLKLGNLIYLYDDNDISIEGSTELAFTENVGQRFQAYGWHVVGSIDGLDIESIDMAIRSAQFEKTKPSLIICRTTIGYGSPNKAGKASVHGEPLGEEEIRLTRENLKWPYPPFEIPSEALEQFRKAVDRGKRTHDDWQLKMRAYRDSYPDEARHFAEDLRGYLSPGWNDGLADLFKGINKPMATREASGQIINALSPKIRTLIGGSADLSPSNKTSVKGANDYSCTDYCGRNLHFGVREHAMGAISNGMALHGGAIPYAGTFLVFSDYMRPSIRLAAMMKLRVIYVFTHDSIGLGEDGPTHQPIEQLMSLRLIPNLNVMRPADATETAEAWKLAIERTDGPTALVLTRQNVPVLDRQTLASAENVSRGGYTLLDTESKPDVILISTGSEVHIALDAARKLQQQTVATRVVSLPSWQLFDAQPQKYRDSVLPPSVKKRISIEAGVTAGWERYVGSGGTVIGISHFGASAPYQKLYEEFGLTTQRVMEEALRLVKRKK
ncbi:MAG TPA: transketolase [Dehalococcoidia bacterium]|nr:transketolase [Dehalococcoidia bacterium]